MGPARRGRAAPGESRRSRCYNPGTLHGAPALAWRRLRLPSVAGRRPVSVPSMSAAGLDAVIWGITTGGRPFRPSDWAERLAGLTSAFGHDQKLAYSPHVRPVTIGGVKAVIVGHELEALEPRLHHFLLGFARDNELHVGFASGAMAAPQRLVPPALAKASPLPEPREPI